MRKCETIILIGALLPLILVAKALAANAPFELVDSNLASYGLNSAVEPVFSIEDRNLYGKILPYLRGDPQQAIRLVEDALGEDSNPAFRFLLGNLYYGARDFEQAERNLKEAVREFPDFQRAHRTLGLIYVQNERYPEAVDSWLKVITLGGGDGQSYGLLGYAYLVEKKYQSALSAYRMARMFKPDSVDFRRGEAQCLMEMGEYRSAVGLFAELISEHPQSAEYWLLQANIYMQMERYDDAVINLEIVHSMGLSTADSLFLLADLHLRDSSYILAVGYYKAAIEKAEAAGESLGSRGIQALRHLVGRGLIDEAEDYLQVLKPYLALESSRDQEEILMLMEAHIALRSDRSELAQQLLETLVRNNPLHAEGLILLAELYRDAEDYEQAKFMLERVLSVPDRKVDALIALGRLEASRGEWTASLQHLRAAQELQPNAEIVRYIQSIESVKDYEYE